MAVSAVVASKASTGVRFAVRVVPRAARTVAGGTRDGRLLVRVSAPPVDGAANDAVVAAIAEAFHVSRRSVRIASGDTARNKMVEIASTNVETIQAILDALSSTPG